MAFTTYKTELICFIQQMQEEGLVNNHFAYLQSLKESVSQDYVVKAVAVYCARVKSLLTSMSLLLEQDAVDFAGLELNVNELVDNSNRTGVEHARILSGYILEGCLMLDKDYCSRALMNVKRAFCKLQQKFEILLEMERNIIDYEAGYDTRVPRLRGCN